MNFLKDKEAHAKIEALEKQIASVAKSLQYMRPFPYGDNSVCMLTTTLEAREILDRFDELYNFFKIERVIPKQEARVPHFVPKQTDKQ